MLLKWPKQGVYSMYGINLSVHRLAKTREATYSFYPHSMVYERLPMGDELCLIFQVLVFSALYELQFP